VFSDSDIRLDFIYVRLETRWLGQKAWFLSPGTLLYMYMYTE